MGYVDFQFYQENYYGDVIPESPFPKYGSRAEDYLNRFTYNRISTKLPDDETVALRIKKCICALAEVLCEYDNYKESVAVDENGKTKQVKSVSAGAESITYAGSESTYAAMAKDPNMLDTVLYGITVKYLDGLAGDDGVCLLYGGL